MWIAHANCKTTGAGNGDEVQEQLLYWMQRFAIATQSQTNTQNTLSLANFGCCQFVNRRRYWQYAQKISILLIYRCHLCRNSSTLSVSHSCSPSSSPYSALSRGWLSDLLLVCSSLLVQFFLCAQFRMFFYYVFFSFGEQKMRIHYECCKLNMSTSTITINMQTRVRTARAWA